MINVPTFTLADILLRSVCVVSIIRLQSLTVLLNSPDLTSE
jgi:hypothetical protein